MEELVLAMALNPELYVRNRDRKAHLLEVIVQALNAAVE